MIASVVARLKSDPAEAQAVIDAINQRPELEIGVLSTEYSLPVVIEADDAAMLENSTEWLKSLDDVLMVDVVFVHFEEHEKNMPQSNNL